MALLEQTVARQQTTALMVIACETLRDTAGVLKEPARNAVTDAGGKGEIRSGAAHGAHRSAAMTVVIANGVKEPWHAITLGQQVLTVINERLPIQGIQLRPSASIGIAMYSGG